MGQTPEPRVGTTIRRSKAAAHAAAFGVGPRRLSFIDARDLLRYHRGNGPAPPILLNPHRPGRDEPRVIKRRKDRYTYMTRPREQLRQERGITHVAA